MTTAPRPLGHAFGRESSGAGDAPRDALAAEAPADRLHNREVPSAAEMAEMLREVQDALGVLDERLEGLQGAQGASALTTRRLAANVAAMGEALARRMRSLEGREAASDPALPAERAAPAALSHASAPRRPDNRLGLTLGMAAALVAVLAGFWLFGRGEVPRAPTRPSRVASPVARAPSGPVATAPVAVKAVAPRPTFTPRRRPPAQRAISAAPADAGPPTAGYRSFGPAAPSAAAPKPTVTDGAPKPPS